MSADGGGGEEADDGVADVEDVEGEGEHVSEGVERVEGEATHTK